MNNKQEHFKKAARISGKCTASISVVLAAAFLIFPLGGGSAAVSAQLDSVHVSQTKTDAVVRPESKKLIPLGHTTGIKLFSEGAMVVGFASPEGEKGKSPAEKAGLKLGDIIIEVEGNPISSNETLAQAVSGAQKKTLAVTAKRQDAVLDFSVSPQLDSASGQYKIGAWVRDSLAGIGTITYVDPENGAFGALGHGVCDQDTGELMPIGGGSVMGSQVVGVKKGECGTPGELTGEYELQRDQGILYQNSNNGIYGQLTDSRVYQQGQALETAEKSEIETGPAQILANVEGDAVKSYDIEIVKIYADEDGSNRDMMVRVVDKNLLNTTGGIVQGMSGSPIIQNGKLIGAVTHVLVNDPQRGYGIGIQRMLETARSL